MRLLTFSFLKNSRLKTAWCRTLSVHPGLWPAELTKPLADASLVEASAEWPAEDEPGLRRALLRNMLVFPDFVTDQEEAALMAELEPYLKRMRYEYDHWDNAIEGYRETERREWSPGNEAVLERMRALAFPCDAALLPHVHVLDLAPAGHIRPHIDAVRFCGPALAGLCLASGAVMRLQHARVPARTAHALLPRRALYVMRDSARYEFSHAICAADGGGGEWRGQRLPRQRRISLICRQQPDQQA